MRLRCRLGWHDWTMWGEPVVRFFKVTNLNTGVKVCDYQKKVQTRRCQDCRVTEDHDA